MPGPGDLRAGGVKVVLVCDGATFRTRAVSGRSRNPIIGPRRVTMGTSRVRIVCTNREATSDQRARGQHRRPRRFRHWVVDSEATPAKITWQQPVRRSNRFSPSFTLAGQSPSDWTRFSTLSCHSSCSGVASAFIWPGGSCLALALGHPSSAHSHRAGVPSSLSPSHTPTLLHSSRPLCSLLSLHPHFASPLLLPITPSHHPTSPTAASSFDDLLLFTNLARRYSNSPRSPSSRQHRPFGKIPSPRHVSLLSFRNPRSKTTVAPHKAHRRRSPHDNPTALPTTANHNDFLLPLQRPPTTPNACFGIGGRSQPPRRPESESAQVIRLAKLAEAVPRCPEYEGARRVPDRAVLQDTVRGRCVI